MPRNCSENAVRVLFLVCAFVSDFAVSFPPRHHLEKASKIRIGDSCTQRHVAMNSASSAATSALTTHLPSLKPGHFCSPLTRVKHLRSHSPTGRPAASHRSPSNSHAIPRRQLWFRTCGSGILGLMAASGGVLSFPFSAGARASATEAEEVLKNVDWPKEWPYKPENFERYDESVDTSFYSQPRFVTHIDDSAIGALTRFYSANLPPSGTPGTAVLDMCSSWISHYPKGYEQKRVAGLGLNEAELARNPVLTEFVVQDLNANPKLPFEDSSFDAVTNAVSVDYLSKPMEIFKEMNRVLKPGGLAAMSFSNRCFWTKAVQIWTATGDVDHCYIVGSYFHYAGGYDAPQAVDLSPNPGRTDPMYVVFARKSLN